MSSPLCIGLDGGATKISGALLERDAKTGQFRLVSDPVEIPLTQSPHYTSDFQPVDITTQLREMETGEIHPTDEERTQSKAFVDTTVKVIQACVPKATTQPILIGMGLPGLKTPDGRGIAAMANGPRMPEFAQRLEERCEQVGLLGIQPLHRLGSDADFCGLGEEYAQDGSFAPVANAYYLGGGTGAADALKLNGQLLPLDKTRDWLAKTWELKSADDLSMERFASAGGIQTIYARVSGVDVSEVVREKIYPDVILDRALQGESTAAETLKIVTNGLADLLSERMETLYQGWQNRFAFVNPNRKPLTSTHPYQGTLLDRIIIGQRLGDLLRRSQSTPFLWKPLLSRLESFCQDHLDAQAQAHYLDSSGFRTDRITLSVLRSAPVLGAGIDAWLNAHPEVHA